VKNAKYEGELNGLFDGDGTVNMRVISSVRGSIREKIDKSREVVQLKEDKAAREEKLKQLESELEGVRHKDKRFALAGA
jgi:hypothetical protein